jgi:hypothetical protein
MRKGRKEKKLDFQHEEFAILCLQLGTEEILDEEDDSNEIWRNVLEPPQILRLELSPRNKEMLLVARFVPTKHNCRYNQGSYKAESQIAGREMKTQHRSHS